MNYIYPVDTLGMYYRTYYVTYSQCIVHHTNEWHTQAHVAHIHNNYSSKETINHDLHIKFKRDWVGGHVYYIVTYIRMVM